MTQLTYPNDVTGSIQIVHGSDGRLNVSSRADARSYYNSRDVGQTYSLVFDDADAAVGDFSVYLQNTSTILTLVMSEVVINTTVAGSFKFHTVTGTAAGGSVLTPVNLNRSSSFDAAANARGNGAVTGLTSETEVAQVIIGADEHDDIDLKDRLRLGQNDAVALEFDRGAGNTILEGTLFFFFE